MKSKALKAKVKAASKADGLCKRLNKSIFWPLWLIEELDEGVTKAGFRSFSKYLESIAYTKLGYTKKTYDKKCREEGRKKSK